MSKLLCFIITLILLLFCLVGCANRVEKNDSSNVSIKTSSVSAEDELQSIIDDYLGDMSAIELPDDELE
jgi:uncharacterized lipoprotein NlpE involved in copper resistance